ncbi:antitoxin Xre/MbcA/ParS toxin-binding domain-containing protein [Chitinimonas sp. PSY-7]|uniref:antitoxin Xre/MbcA/ParS toxin-binding domain-containing protein n=1 Tax=Chitinimonas sp. PSY-7 TaxID=3459088 RepID=UPI0040400CEE
MSIQVKNVADLEAYAVKVFGDSERARQWLQSPHRLLDGSPAHCAIQPDGLEKVVAILVKIEHGLPV